MQTFFHCAPIPLAAGSVILPGNWGRLLRSYKPHQINEVLYREAIFEQVRQQRFHNAPSRLESIFLLETEAEAVAYRRRYSPNSIVYEVVAGIEGRVHRGYYLLSLPAHASVMQAMLELAQSYWRGEGMETGCVEVLLEAPITVVRDLGAAA